MRIPSLIAIFMFTFSSFITAQTAAELSGIWEEQKVTKIVPSNMRHRDVVAHLEELKKIGLDVRNVGKSNAGRDIFQVEFGRGPMKVFMWSQMHGDEPTATPALMDMFTVLQNNRDKDWVKQIAERLTIRAVPMLNPDGAEMFVRRNLQGIDINRDAIDLKTPEGKLLKELRDAWSPEIGFNLHNQNEMTTAGNTPKQAAISFLVVYGDEEKTESVGHVRNKRLTVAMNRAIAPYLPGHIGRYDDEWTPNAFGDNFSKWGTPTILIETGALHSQDEMYLVKMNFIAFMTAIKTLAEGSEISYDPNEYDLIPRNGRGLAANVIFRNVNLITKNTGVTPEEESAVKKETVDIGISFQRRRAGMSIPAFIRRIGSLTASAALDEYDVSGFNVIGRFEDVATGKRAELLFYKASRNIDWLSEDLEKTHPPDAVYSTGKFVLGEELIKKIK